MFGVWGGEGPQNFEVTGKLVSNIFNWWNQHPFCRLGCLLLFTLVQLTTQSHLTEIQMIQREQFFQYTLHSGKANKNGSCLQSFLFSFKLRQPWWLQCEVTFSSHVLLQFLKINKGYLMIYQVYYHDGIIILF